MYKHHENYEQQNIYQPDDISTTCIQSTTVSNLKNYFVLFLKNKYLLKGVRIMETKSYLPIIRQLTEKLTKDDFGFFLFKSFLENVGVHIILINMECNVFFCSDTLVKLLGDYKEQKCYSYLMGKSSRCSDCILEKDIYNTKHCADAYIRKFKNNNEYLLIDCFVKDNGNSYIFKIAFDLTRSDSKECYKNLFLKLVNVLENSENTEEK